MNILELDSFNLADAVKFNDELNPRIWDGTAMRPEVRAKLLEIAADFKEFLGLSDLDVKDITVSGSNAAYTYTPQSDIDLHLVVDIPRADQDEVYRELFDAKKYEYNDIHNIKIGGYDVELYVENANKPPVSKGVFSVLNNDWISIPRQRKATIDDDSVRSKYEDIKHRIEDAVKSNDAERINTLARKIKAYRQAGLDAHGELGSENLAYKMLRNQGYIEKLYKARAAARDRELSLAEQNREKKPVVYGFKTEDVTLTPDGVSPSTKMFLSEQDPVSDEDILKDFIDFVVKELKIEQLPVIKLRRDPQWSVMHKTFGRYVDEKNLLEVAWGQRHIMDVLRTVAHELTHRRQHEREDVPMSAGETGSPWENEANARAGILMRDYARLHPEYFEAGQAQALHGDEVNESASGYIPTAREKNDPRFKMALTRDIKPGQVGKEANKLALDTNKQGKPSLIYKSVNQLAESLRQEYRLFEDEDLFEIKMSPSSLRAEAAKTGAQAGMEFEMIVPDVVGSDEPEYEPNMDQDTRTRSFSDIEDFFYDGDYNSRRDVQRLIDKMNDAFIEWQDEQIFENWQDEGIDVVRDYIKDNDLWDEEEAQEEATNQLQAEYGDDISPEEFQKMLDALVKEKFDEFVTNQYNEQGRIYDEAREMYFDLQREDFDEGDWLRENYPYMSDISNNFDIQWPYYIDINEGGEADVERVANDFSDAVDMRVNYSTSYHGGRREPDAYVVEPDSSLDPDDSNDYGLEFVSPPMEIDQMIDQLNKVKAWADSYGCYTNKSTGLHINISVPNFDLAKLDYVKLALLLGDKYILDQYGRSSNTYAKSALGKVQELIKKDPSKGKDLLDKMRGHMEDLATKAIHSGTTDKYTSINTKEGYIEFRSPGGDWLNANFDKIENTLMRFTVALSAAMDPAAYREEYLKKLYKLLEPVAEETQGIAGKGAKDTVQYFADYVAGKTPKAALRSFVKQAQLERQIKRGNVGGEVDYWWRVSNPQHSDASIEVVARTKADAIAKALEPSGYPSWKNTMADIVARPLRPYDQSPVKATAGAAQPVQQSGQYTYRVFTTDTNQTLGAFQSDGIQGSTTANIAFRNYLTTLGRASDAGVDYYEIGRQRPRQQPVSTQSDANTPPASGEGMSGNWGIWMSSANRFARWPGEYPAGQEVPLRRFTTQQAAQSYLDDLRQSRPDLRRDLEIREIEPPQPQTQQPAQQTGGVINTANEPTTGDGVGQTYNPSGTGQFTGQWLVLDPNNRVIYRFGGIGNSQSDANRMAMQWLQRNPAQMQDGVTVVPELA